jgi:hypothetical protein
MDAWDRLSDNLLAEMFVFPRDNRPVFDQFHSPGNRVDSEKMYKHNASSSQVQCPTDANA